MKKMKSHLLLALLFITSHLVLAHPGHDETSPHAHDPNSVMHYLTSPIHVAGIVLVLGGVVALAYRWQTRKHRRPTR
jgi:hypothetical protein